MSHYDDSDDCRGSMAGGPCKNSGAGGPYSLCADHERFLSKRRQDQIKVLTEALELYARVSEWGVWAKDALAESAKISNDSRDISVWGFK